MICGDAERPKDLVSAAEPVQFIKKVVFTSPGAAYSRLTDSDIAELRKADRFTIKTGTEENTFPLEGADFDSLIRACSKS